MLPNRIRQRATEDRFLAVAVRLGARFGVFCFGAALLGGALRAAEPAVELAVGYLSREVSLWKPENHCFSCHNNGDGARALLAARRLGLAVEAGSIEETLKWLATPERWEIDSVGGGSSDKKLARLQFAVALADAVAVGAIKSREALLTAAKLLAADQQDDGSWRIEEEAGAGSPATWGSPLATAMGRRVLVAADTEGYRLNVRRAEHWLAELESAAVVDRAAVAMGLADAPNQGERLARAVAGLLQAQGASGGWGAFAGSPPEVFDTAVALLALAGEEADGEAVAAVRRGREFLLAAQLEPGGWIETTRPAGSQSYAQHISTSAWAALALMETSKLGVLR